MRNILKHFQTYFHAYAVYRNRGQYDKAMLFERMKLELAVAFKGDDVADKSYVRDPAWIARPRVAEFLLKILLFKIDHRGGNAGNTEAGDCRRMSYASRIAPLFKQPRPIITAVYPALLFSANLLRASHLRTCIFPGLSSLPLRIFERYSRSSDDDVLGYSISSIICCLVKRMPIFENEISAILSR
jgi:hypothetical protein